MHMTQTTSKINSVVEKATKDDCNGCKHTEYDSITKFKARFDTRLLANNQDGNRNDNEVADFLYSLDKLRYVQFI